MRDRREHGLLRDSGSLRTRGLGGKRRAAGAGGWCGRFADFPLDWCSSGAVRRCATVHDGAADAAASRRVVGRRAPSRYRNAGPLRDSPTAALDASASKRLQVLDDGADL